MTHVHRNPRSSSVSLATVVLDFLVSRIVRSEVNQFCRLVRVAGADVANGSDGGFFLFLLEGHAKGCRDDAAHFPRQCISYKV